MVNFKTLIFILGFIVVKATYSESNCDTGHSLIECGDGEARCAVACVAGEFMSTGSCTTLDCKECIATSWCDGLDYYMCPNTMKSQPGSINADDCVCHGGHTLNGDTCPICPEESWCDGIEANICPVGTTSNLASRSGEDCYCLDGYTGDIDCAQRTNTSHSRCDPGYAHQGVDTNSDGEEIDMCQLCASSYWCDGTDYFNCPTESPAMYSSYGKSSYDECFCPLDYISGYAGSPCIPCPGGSWCDRDGEHSCPTGTTSSPGNSNPNCVAHPTPTGIISTVEFTVSIEMGLGDFQGDVRDRFVQGVADALEVDVSNIAIKSVTQKQLTQRRLLAESIDVVVTAKVPRDAVESVAASVTNENLSSVFSGGEFAVSNVSTPLARRGMSSNEKILILHMSRECPCNK